VTAIRGAIVHVKGADCETGCAIRATADGNGGADIAIDTDNAKLKGFASRLEKYTQDDVYRITSKSFSHKAATEFLGPNVIMDLDPACPAISAVFDAQAIATGLITNALSRRISSGSIDYSTF